MTEILKITSAVVIGGKIVAATGKNLVEVSNGLGGNLRGRGKAVTATEDDIANGEVVARDIAETVTPLTERVPEPEADADHAPTDTLKRRRRAE